MLRKSEQSFVSVYRVYFVSIHNIMMWIGLFDARNIMVGVGEPVIRKMRNIFKKQIFILCTVIGST